MELSSRDNINFRRDQIEWNGFIHSTEYSPSGSNRGQGEKNKNQRGVRPEESETRKKRSRDLIIVKSLLYL